MAKTAAEKREAKLVKKINKMNKEQIRIETKAAAQVAALGNKIEKAMAKLSPGAKKAAKAEKPAKADKPAGKKAAKKATKKAAKKNVKKADAEE